MSIAAVTPIRCIIIAVNHTEELCFQDVFALLVFLLLLECLVVLPAYDSSAALLAVNIPDDMFACGHVSFVWFAVGDVGDDFEEVGLSMLAPEVLWTKKLARL